MIYLDFFGGAGGVGRVSRELIPALAEASGQAVLVAGPSFAIDSLRESLTHVSGSIEFENLTPPKFSLRRAHYELAMRSDPVSGAAFDYSHRELSRRGFQTPGLTLVNFPQILHPPRSRREVAILIHDLNWRSFPENFENPPRLDRWARDWIQRSAVTFTNSEFTRQEVLEAYGIAPNKVIAAPLAPFARYQGVDRDEGFLESLGLSPNGYYLYPSAHGAHKGHDVLCAALRAARTTYPVVVTCGSVIPARCRRWASAATQLMRDVQTLSQEGRLRVLPYVSESAIDALRQYCRGYVLPSRYEGYGFPLAEAFALGKAVMFSAIPAYLEIAERHGGLRHRTFPPGDSETFAMLLEADYADELHWNVSEGHGSLESWNWKRTAEIVLNGCRAAQGSQQGGASTQLT